MKANLLILAALLGACFTSCIKDEPLNREADIIDIVVDDETFIDRSISSNDTIQLIMFDQANLSKIAPIIKISSGASISPASGDTVDFSNDKVVKYTVTSEDGNYSKNYFVEIGDVKLKYSFEKWTDAGSNTNPYPILSDPMWKNANEGIIMAIVVGAIPRPDPFPTDRTTDCAEGEYAASLTTIKGGRVIIKTIPIFAGNLFRGDFKADMGNPLKSLYLGRNHPRQFGKPISFEGFYKYKPGKEVTGANGKPVPDAVDQMSMYAALFRVTKGAKPDEEYLNGEDILTSERVVAKAEWEPDSSEITETEYKNGFTQFSIPFKYTEELDYKNYDYRLTIVCSSSKDGNLYVGAVGSNLIVDELEIKCEPIPVN